MAYLSKAKAEKFIHHKIPILLKEGYPQKQAEAIAYSEARKKGARL